MSTHTWSQYVAVEDAGLEPGLLEAALANFETEALGDWDDDFEIGEAGLDVPLSEIDDAE